MLDFQVRDGIAWVTLQRPAVLNAINEEMANMFRSRVEELESRSDVRVLITRGEGRAFCVGSDLRELAHLSAEEAAKYELRFAAIFSSLDRLPQPTIAVLHGHVLGGGLGLAMYHDFRIASSHGPWMVLKSGFVAWAFAWHTTDIITSGVGKATI